MVGGLWLLLILALISETTAADVMPGCPGKCGDIDVPYPFGINFTSGISLQNPNCSLSPRFMFTCNDTFNPPTLYFSDMPVQHISVEEGTFSIQRHMAFRCYERGWVNDSTDFVLRMRSSPFRFSDRNMITVIGCDTIGLIGNGEGEQDFVRGCVSYCAENVVLQDSCSGVGCCQLTVPQNLSEINFGVVSMFNHTNVSMFNPCDYAFLADERTFKISDMNLSMRPIDPNTKQNRTSEIAVEWVVREETCEAAQANPSTYACGNYSNCIYSENGNGYRCACNNGFIGNPYLPQGCQDIDECQEPDKYPCHGTCKNTIGSYSCKCPFGKRGDGKVRCRDFPYATVFGSVGGFLSIFIISILAVISYKKRRNEKNFLKNGGLVLKHQRVRIFREAELEKATKNYDPTLLLGEGGFGYVYKGILSDNTEIAVKKPKDKDKTHINQEFQQEIGIVSQINHRNVVKVLGLCLETNAPLLVYEFISNGTLYEHIHRSRSNILDSWKNRLRIAAEAALALDYLHSLADPPIIHGDVKSSNILLDETYTAKVSDFGASVLISPGKSDMAKKIQGTFGYLDPEYLMTGELTVKSDVYSFGVVLVELLTGLKPTSRMRSDDSLIEYFLSSLENNDLSQVLGFVASEGEMEEIEHFAKVAKHCLHNSGRKRPSMKEVAEEVGRLRKLHESSWDDDQSPKETQSLLRESSYASIYVGSSQQDVFTATTFDVDFSSDSI